VTVTYIWIFTMSVALLTCLNAMDHLPDITNPLSSEELFNTFKAQLTKDFDQSNFPSLFVASLKPDYNHILEKIAHELQRHEKTADFKLMNLLYRVDISEAQLKRYLSNAQHVDHFKIIAELIIKRVLQKVVIKKYYRSQDNP